MILATSAFVELSPPRLRRSASPPSSCPRKRTSSGSPRPNLSPVPPRQPSPAPAPPRDGASPNPQRMCRPPAPASASRATLLPTSFATLSHVAALRRPQAADLAVPELRSSSSAVLRVSSRRAAAPPLSAPASCPSRRFAAPGGNPVAHAATPPLSGPGGSPRLRQPKPAKDVSPSRAGVRRARHPFPSQLARHQSLPSAAGRCSCSAGVVCPISPAVPRASSRRATDCPSPHLPAAKAGASPLAGATLSLVPPRSCRRATPTAPTCACAQLEYLRAFP